MDFIGPVIAIAGGIAGVLFFGFVAMSTLYRRCPPNRILVVYGTRAAGRSAKCIHGGGTVVVPLLQGSQYMSLEPIAIDIPLQGALSRQNIRINSPSTFTVGISTDPEIMANAAERLLGLNEPDIAKRAEDIIIGQLRLVVATMDIEEINKDREKFLEQINVNVTAELNKIGLQLINVNIKDITDESGYLEAIGQRAAAEAINRAKAEVAEQVKLGAIGEAKAKREMEVEVARQLAEAQKGRKAAEADQRIATSRIEAEAIAGENEAKVLQAKTKREMDVRVAQELAEAEKGRKTAEASQRVAVSMADADAVKGENQAEILRAQSHAEREIQSSTARERGQTAWAKADAAVSLAYKEAEVARIQKDELARREVEKLKMEVDAEALAEQARRMASGQAAATLAHMKAEADGVRAQLLAKTDGYRSLIDACQGDARAAATFLLLEKLEELVDKQTAAISKLKIDKITVWDQAGGGGQGTSTARFLNGLVTSLPPLHELARQAGLELPSYLGKVTEDEAPPPDGGPFAEPKG